MVNHEIVMIIVFFLIIGTLIYIDLEVLNKRSHVISTKEAALYSFMWISIALLFNAGVYFYVGREKAIEFLTAYLVEESLSVDNLFVFVVILEKFSIHRRYQPRVLKWGILGAIIFRAIFIVAGIELIKVFEWMIYIFGLVLIYTGIKLFLEKDKTVEPEKSRTLKLIRRWFPVTVRSTEGKFFIKRMGKRFITRMFLALVLIETTDIIFAFDSIPAVIAITRDPFIAYTSNIFAVLGLRSLFFLISNLVVLFRFLKYGVATILIFVGIKMLLSHYYHIPNFLSLLVIVVILGISILLSLVIPEGKDRDQAL